MKAQNYELCHNTLQGSVEESGMPTAKFSVLADWKTNILYLNDIYYL